MISALIGHTGFVGSNLDRALKFEARFNSKNFKEMEGREFERVICAGFSSVKWIANREPEEDWRRVIELMKVIETITTDEFVLISTIDVYPDPTSEGDETSQIDPEQNHAYGQHRRQIELWAESTFRLTRTVRLPALFGPGLKKNVLFDLMNDNEVNKINPYSVFQWYPLERLIYDLDIIWREDLKLVNLFSEPLLTKKILDHYFPDATVSPIYETAPQYNLKTCHCALFGGEGKKGYVMTAEAELNAIGEFVKNR